MRSLSKGKMWLLAVGQLGRSMLPGLISNWLVQFYQPAWRCIPKETYAQEMHQVVEPYLSKYCRTGMPDCRPCAGACGEFLKLGVDIIPAQCYLNYRND